jgi:hypothetical protein
MTFIQRQVEQNLSSGVGAFLHERVLCDSGAIRICRQTGADEQYDKQ